MALKRWVCAWLGIVYCAAVFAASATTKEEFYKKGLELKEKQKSNDALQQFRSAIEIDPSYIEAHRQYMAILSDQGKVEELQKEYRLLLDQHPNSAPHLYLYARLLKDDNQSLRYYLKARDLDPSFVWPYLGLGYIYRAKGLNNQSMDSLNTGLKLDPNNGALKFSLAATYEKLGNTQKAKEIYQILTSDLEQRSSALLNLGDLYHSEKQFLKAKDCYEKFLEKNDKNAWAHFRLGYAYDQLKKPDKAADEYKETLDLDPKMWLPANNLGVYYYDVKKDPKKAEQYYLLALKIDSKAVLPRKNLSKLYLHQQRYPDALQHSQELIKINPMDTEPYFNAGIALDKQEQHYSALKYFTAVYELDTKPYPHYWNIGLMYRKTGEYDKAFKLFKMLKQAAPDNPNKKDVEEWLPYLQEILSNVRVNIENIQAEPSTVRRGNVINMVLEYSISGAADNKLLLTEERTIDYGNQRVGSPIVHYQRLSNGKYKSIIQLKIPSTAKPGNYIYTGWLNLCGAKAEKMAAFKVL